MFLPFRRSTQKSLPLPVVMSGVRAGERVLQIGIDDPAIATAITARPGINGHAAFLLPDDRLAARARQAAERALTVAEIEVASPPRVPFGEAAFDLVVLHARTGPLAALAGEPLVALIREAVRTLRRGGRLVVMAQGTAVGLGAWFSASRPSTPGVDEALRHAGCRPVRTLADREGYLFTEGLKPQA